MKSHFCHMLMAFLQPYDKRLPKIILKSLGHGSVNVVPIH
jgi:hypothetical protein